MESNTNKFKRCEKDYRMCMAVVTANHDRNTMTYFIGARRCQDNVLLCKYDKQ